MDWNQTMDIAMSFNNTLKNVTAKRKMVEAYIEARDKSGLMI